MKDEGQPMHALLFRFFYFIPSAPAFKLIEITIDRDFVKKLYPYAADIQIDRDYHRPLRSILFQKIKGHFSDERKVVSTIFCSFSLSLFVKNHIQL